MGMSYKGSAVKGMAILGAVDGGYAPPFYDDMAQWLNGGMAPETTHEVNDRLNPTGECEL